MISYQQILKKILLKDEEKFFYGLSFVIISLIAIHVILYFNFYKFSSNWIDLESKKTTFILSNNADEKEIPISVSENIKDFLINNTSIDSYKIIDSVTIKDSLGLESIDELSGLDLPMIFQVVSNKKEVVDSIYKNIIDISQNRFVEKYSHEDQLFEISIIVNRIKVIIFIMFLLVFILFSFLVMNIVKAALVSNFKLLEMLQIMGASSIELAKNISQSIIKKILPGALLSLVFVFLVSILLINLFGANFQFFDSSFFVELVFSSLFLLLLFMILFLLFLLIFLTTYLYHFFENRFFDKL